MSVGDTNIKEDLKTLAFDKTGVVRVWIDEKLHTLRRPKWGEYRRIRDAMTEATTLAARAQDLQDRAKGDVAGMDTDLIKETLALQDEMTDIQITTYRLIFNGEPNAEPPVKPLSDIPLPDDPDEWDAWLLSGDDVLGQLLEHWRARPLARGGQ